MGRMTLDLWAGRQANDWWPIATKRLNDDRIGGATLLGATYGICGRFRGTRALRELMGEQLEQLDTGQFAAFLDAVTKGRQMCIKKMRVAGYGEKDFQRAGWLAGPDERQAILAELTQMGIELPDAPNE